MKQAPLIVVIYDGIDNSVFDSQVMLPLSKLLESNQDQTIILVSFEKQQPPEQKIRAKIPQHPSLTFICCKKMPYIGTLSLYGAVYSLKKILKAYQQYNLQARGPLAGFICQQACQQSSCNSLTIQARGLLAQEYSYEHCSNRNWFSRLLYTFRHRQFFSLEHAAYSKSAIRKPIPCTIQAVSKALAEYLITVYGADRSRISIASHDIPHQIDRQQLTAWKNTMRSELGIPQDALVYCYNGSIKPWQCPEQVINYFAQKYATNSRALLYILTHDKTQFEGLINKAGLAAYTYRVLTVDHTAIYRYLAVADIGIMFREPHIVNWTSRPTKALEYKAAGLIIEHNNTVSWLLEEAKNSLRIAT